MNVKQLFRSILACLLILSVLSGMAVGAFAAPADSEGSDGEQVTLRLDGDVSSGDADEGEDLTQEEVDAKVEEKVDSMLEAVGIDADEARGQTREIVGTECVFLDFRIGDASRNFNWQIKSDYKKDSATVDADTFNSRDRLYFSANYNGCIAGYYQGTDPRLYMPEINTSIANGKLGNYVVKSGDIVQIRIQSISANADNGFESGSDKTVQSLFALRTSADATQYTSGTYANLLKRTEAQVLNFSINSKHYNQTLYGVRWDPSQTELKTSGVRIYLDYIYIGPKSKAPVPYYIYDENGAYFKNADGGSVGFGHVVSGKTGPKFAHGKTSTKNTADGTQDLWGWKVEEKENNAWVEKKFVLSPSDHVITKEVRFKLVKVTIPIAGLQSGQTVTSTGAETFVITNDTFSSAEIDTEKYCTPQDITLLFDRSASNDTIVSSKGSVTRTSSSTEANDYAKAKGFLSKLDASKWSGYYRCTAWGYGHVDGNIHQQFTMPMRYYNGAWQVLMVSADCDCYWGYHYNYGVFEWLSTGLQACKHTTWVSYETAYKFYRTHAKATSGSKGYVAFEVGISRLGMLQDALDQFTQLLYNSGTSMAPNKAHTLSIIGFGKTCYINGASYRYYDMDSGTNKYKKLGTAHLGYSGGVSKTIANLTYSDYEAFNFCIKNYYVNGNTSTDAATQVLIDKLNKFDSGNGLTTPPYASTSYLAAKATGRQRVLILVTDGCPSNKLGGGQLFDLKTANAALSAANTLENNGVIIYAICLDSNVSVSNSTLVADSTFKWDLATESEYESGYDVSKAMEGKRQHVFLQLYSSNFKKANSMDDRPARASTNYVKASNSAGDTIATIFKSILTSEVAELSTSKVIGPGSLYIHQEINREFTIDASKPIRIYGAPHTTNKSFGTPVLIGEHYLSKALTAQTFTGKGYTLSISPVSGTERFVVTLKWADAQDAFMRNGDITTAISGLSTKRGYKISLEIPCVVNRENTLGGNNIPINVLNNSGLYKAANKNDNGKASSASIKYAQPNINVQSSVSGKGYDYFMSLDEYMTMKDMSADALRKYILGNMCDGLEVRAANSAGKSTLDYLSFGLTLKEKDTQAQVMTKTAALGATSMTESWPQAVGNFDPLKDTDYTLNVTMTQKNNSTDSFGNAPFPSINVELNPSYYAPKFAVVDFDGELALDMQNEGDPTKISYSDDQFVLNNGKLYFNYKPDFDDASAQKQLINDGYLTVDYTIDHANPTKAMATVAPDDLTMERELYIIPGNVMTYDDTYFHLYTTEHPNLAQWNVVGTYTEETITGDASEVHGYEAAYMDNTGDLAGASVVSTVSKTLVSSNASFEFTGTGFELLSRTAPDSGVIIAEIFPMNADGTYAEISSDMILVDTYLSNATLYQIPVMQWSSEYGQYKVVLTGFYDKIFDHNRSKKSAITEDMLRELLNVDESTNFTYIPSQSAEAPATRGTAKEGQYNIYLDGVRVFNPLGNDVSDPVVEAIYGFATEGVANIININDSIVDANSTFKESSKVDGILYVASDGEGNDALVRLEDQYVNQGFHLGMSGNSSVGVEQDGDLYYLMDENGNHILHPLSGHPISYTMNGKRPSYQAVIANELSENSIFALLDSRYPAGGYYVNSKRAYAVYDQDGERLLTSEGWPVKFVYGEDGKRIYYSASEETLLTDYKTLYLQNRHPFPRTPTDGKYEFEDANGQSYYVDKNGNFVDGLAPADGCIIYSKNENVTAPFYYSYRYTGFNELGEYVVDQLVEKEIKDPDILYKSYLDSLSTMDVELFDGEIRSYVMSSQGTVLHYKNADDFVLVKEVNGLRSYYVVMLDTPIDFGAVYGLSTQRRTYDCDVCGAFTAQFVYYSDGEPMVQMTRYNACGTTTPAYTPCEYPLPVYYRDDSGTRTYYYGHTLRSIPHWDVYDAIGEITYYDSYYEAVGPEKEVYLKGSSGIAFNVGAGNEKVMISLKSVGTAPATVQVYNTASNAWVNLLKNFSFATEMYFDVTPYIDAEGNIYIRGNNTNSDAIVSLCNVKIIGGVATLSVSRSLVRSASAIFRDHAELPIDDSVAIMHSLNLRSNISINYIVSKDALAEYDHYYMTAELNGKTYELYGVENGPYMYFTLDKLHAGMMNDPVRAQLKAYKGSKVYTSEVDDYSIATYAFTMMNRDNATEQFKRVCANLLRYGAATQTYLGYNTDALADEELTEEQRAYLWDLDTVTFGSNYTVGNDVADATVVWQGRTLSLTSTITVKLVVNVSEYEGNAEDLELRVSYVAANGEEKTFTVAPQVYNADKGQYLFDVDQLNAADLRAVLTCQVFAGDVAVSQTLTYSADTYGNGKTGTLLDLCKALFAYVDEAKAYFG